MTEEERKHNEKVQQEEVEAMRKLMKKYPRGQVPVTEPLIPPPPSTPAKEKPESKDFLDLPKTTVP